MARAAKPMATATLLNDMMVMSREIESVMSATTRKTAAAVAHIANGLRVGGAACFDNANSCDGFRSEFAGSPV